MEDRTEQTFRAMLWLMIAAFSLEIVNQALQLVMNVGALCR